MQPKHKNEALHAKIVADVCQYYIVTKEQLYGKSNVGRLSTARQVVFYLTYHEANYTHIEAARALNRSSHGDSLYAVQTIKDILHHPQTAEAKDIILFFKMYAYQVEKFKPLVRMERAV